MPAKTMRLNDAHDTRSPSPEQIRRRCRQVSRPWSGGQLLNRAGFRKTGFVSPEQQFLRAVFPRREKLARTGSAA